MMDEHEGNQSQVVHRRAFWRKTVGVQLHLNWKSEKQMRAFKISIF